MGIRYELVRVKSFCENSKPFAIVGHREKGAPVIQRFKTEKAAKEHLKYSIQSEKEFNQKQGIA